MKCSTYCPSSLYKNITITFITLLLLISLGFSQGASNFQRVYGGTLQDEGFSIINTQDGGYAVTGFTRSFGAGNDDVYVIKMDANGTEVWSRTFGGTGNDRGYTIVQTSDGGYMVGGDTQSFGSGNQDLFLIRLDADGNTIWTKVIGLSLFEYTRIVRTTPDGGFVSLGYSNSTGLGQSDLLLVKISAAGDIEWTRAYGLSVNEFPHYLEITADSGFAIIGYRNLGSSFWELYMLKADKLGNFEWAKTYSGPNLENGTGGLQTNLHCSSDGGFVITGFTTSFGAGGRDVLVIKTNSLGDVTWAKTYGGTANDVGLTVLQKQNGDFVIGGTSASFGSGSDDFYLLTTDSLGNLKSSSSFGGPNIDLAANLDNNIQFTPDGGLIMCGRTNSFGSGGNDVYLIKIDSLGNSGCNQIDNVATVVTSPTLTVNAITPNVISPTLNISIPSSLITAPVTLQDTLCITLAPSLATQLRTQDCDITDVELSDTLIADVVANATAYDFLIEHSPSSFSFTYASSDEFLPLSAVTGLETGKTYTVTVRATVNSIIGSYGPGCTFSLHIDAPQSSNFQRVFGGTAEDQGLSIINTQDGGYAVTGGTKSFGAGNDDVYVVKLDVNGNEQWSKTFGGPGIDKGFSIIQTSDGGYMIGAETRTFGSGNQDLFLIRLDPNGNTIWIKVIGLSLFEYTRVIRETPDGGFVSLGYSNSTGLGQSDVLLVKVSSSGDIEWTKAYGLSVNEFPHYLDITSDSGFAIIGYRNLGSLWELYVIRADKFGDFEWAKTYSGPNLENGTGGLQTNLRCSPDGGFVITGFTTSFGAGGRDVLVIKTNSVGDVSWAKTYGGTGNDAGYTILQKQNGDYIIGGITSSFGSGSDDFYLLTTDSLGNLISSSTFGGTGIDLVAFLDNNLQITPEGGIIMCGRTNSFGFGSDDVYIIKIDPEGNSGCNQIDNVATVVTSPTLTVNAITPNVISPTLNVSIPTPVVTSPTTLEDTLCITLPSVLDIDLGTASDFAILANGEVIAPDTMFMFGNIGSNSTLSTKLAASNIVFTSSSPQVIHALADLQDALNTIDNVVGTQIGENLGNGQALVPDVYDILANITISGELILSGDSSSIYVFRTNDSIFFKTNCQIVLNGVCPSNLYWTANYIELDDSVNASGIMLSKISSIISKGVNDGALAFLSLGDVQIVKHKLLEQPTYIFSRNEMIKPRPLTQLSLSSCSATDVDQSQDLGSQLVADATEYEFLVQNSNLAYSRSITVGPHGVFSFSELGNAPVYNTVFDVQVRAKFGTLSSKFGPICQVQFGSEFVKGALWIAVTDDDTRPASEGSIRTGNSSVNQIFDDFLVYSYKEVFKSADNVYLKSMYEILCDCDETQLANELQQNSGSHMIDIIPVVEEQTLYNPADYMWQLQLQGQDWLWHIPNIEADKAWDIVRGDPDLEIAIVDVGRIDILHPDLESKIDPIDPLTGNPHAGISVGGNEHPTIVSSLLVGETAETGTIADGQMASVGFNSEAVYYQSGNFVERVLHAVKHQKARIISNSYYGGCNFYPWIPGFFADIFADDGVIVLSGAGNGPQDCGGGPLSPWAFDNRVIVVSSTSKQNKHEHPTTPLGTHSHYPRVDICAPGYHIMVAMPSGGSAWPYYGTGNGTSLATPIVAAVVALILDVNPCLNRVEVRTILDQTTDPIVDEATLFPGLLGSGKVNAFEAVKLAGKFGLPDKTYLTDETISSPEFHRGNIIINPGVELTITTKVRFSENSQIIVEPGGHLILDGGTLSSNCLWRGITLKGSNTVSQSGAQGTLTMINGSVIENAERGVDNIDDLGNISGGIIKADNSTFRNNQIGVLYYPYKNFIPVQPGSEINNISFFKECTFITDKKLNEAASVFTFVGLVGTKGITFKGNTFVNSTSQDLMPGIERGYGVLSYDSEYIIQPFAISPTQPIITPCIFEGLFKGINAKSLFQPLKKVTISRVNFAGNFESVLIEGVNNVEIKDNEFDMTPVPYPIIAYGLYLDGCSGYEVSENTFSTLQDPPPLSYSMFVRNSYSAPNLIYRNEFSKTYAGIIALDDNDGPSTYDGLQIRCNKFTKNIFDMAVIGRDPLIVGDVSLYQGLCHNLNDPTGNLFSHSCAQPESDYYVDKLSPQSIYYLHQEDAKTRPQNSCFDNNFLIPTPCLGYKYIAQFSCPQLTSISDLLLMLDTTTNRLEVISENINGGNSEQLLNLINQDPELSAGILKNVLLEATPLSDEILSALINKKTPVPPGILKEVVIANSPLWTEVILEILNLKTELPSGILKEILQASSPLTNQVLDAITSFNPSLPPGVIKDINSHQSDPSILSERQNSLLEIASLTAKRELIIDELVRKYLGNDSIPAGLDSVIALLEAEGSTNANIKLIAAYIQKGDLTKAQQRLFDISDEPELQEFIKLQSVIIDLLNNNKTIFDLIGSNEQKIRDIAAADGQLGSVNARAVLNLVFEEEFPLTIQAPELFGGKYASPTAPIAADPIENNLKKIQDHQMWNYPNPYEDGTSIEIILPATMMNCQLIISSILGEKISEYNLSEGYNIIEFGSDGKSAGLYIYSLYSNSLYIDSRRMVQTK